MEDRSYGDVPIWRTISLEFWYAASVSAQRISLLNTAPRSLPDLLVSKKMQDDDVPLQHAPLTHPRRITSDYSSSCQLQNLITNMFGPLSC